MTIDFDSKQVATATASGDVFMEQLTTPTRPNPYIDVTVNVTATSGAITATLKSAHPPPGPGSIASLSGAYCSQATRKSRVAGKRPAP